jgi:colicin import membrane protein
VSQKKTDVIAAAMSKPGVILRRPVGSNGSFKEHAHLPTHLSPVQVKGRPAKLRAKHQKQPSRKIDDKTGREAALAFEREQKQRENERGKEEAARAKEHGRRQKAIAKAEGALARARRT